MTLTHLQRMWLVLGILGAVVTLLHYRSGLPIEGIIPYTSGAFIGYNQVAMAQTMFTALAAILLGIALAIGVPCLTVPQIRLVVPRITVPQIRLVVPRLTVPHHLASGLRWTTKESVSAIVIFFAALAVTSLMLMVFERLRR
jgi:hypothetical protein